MDGGKIIPLIFCELSLLRESERPVSRVASCDVSNFLCGVSVLSRGVPILSRGVSVWCHVLPG